jgi:hypothetical protein
MAAEEIIEYRGYLLMKRVYRGTATDRIARRDGTWRFSEPTIVDDWVGWVIARQSANEVEELEAAASYEEARRWVDARLATGGSTEPGCST